MATLPSTGDNGRSHRASPTWATRHSQVWDSPHGHGVAQLSSGTHCLPREPVFGVWAAVVVFLVPRSHGQIALFALTRKPVTTCKSSGMDSDCSPGLPRFQHLFIAQQNLFCCGSQAEPECEAGAEGGTCVWLTEGAGSRPHPCGPKLPRSCPPLQINTWGGWGEPPGL